MEKKSSLLIVKNGGGSRERIQAFEEKYSIRLSQEYKQFLEKYNGGETPETDYKHGKREEDVVGFYGLNTTRIWELDTRDLDEWVERGMIPVARDWWGNRYAIGVSPIKFGRIFF